MNNSLPVLKTGIRKLIILFKALSKSQYREVEKWYLVRLIA